MISAALHGWSGLAIAYTAVQAPMIAGLDQRAPVVFSNVRDPIDLTLLVYKS